MRAFDKPNLEGGWKCPICGKSDETPVVLIGIAGTEDEDIMEAEQFHLDCINLRYYKDENLIGMAF
jgi:hypothetical protein